MAVTLLFREELVIVVTRLCGHREEFAQMGALSALRGCEEFSTNGEDPEELIVKIVAIGKNHNGGVLHGRFPTILPA